MLDARGFRLEQYRGTGYGTCTGAVRAHCAAASKAAGQCRPLEPSGNQCHSLRGRAWLQVAMPAGTVRQPARHLYAHEPVVEERRSRPVFEHLQREQEIRVRIEALGLDSASIKVHPDGTGALTRLQGKSGQDLPIFNDWLFTRST